MPGTRCRSLSDVPPWYSYTDRECGSETPSDQGKVIVVNSETDVQLLGGWKARASRSNVSHYRAYEVAGASHIPTTYLPLKAAGLRPSELPDQNYVNTQPVFRAMMEHLSRWASASKTPPDSAYLGGHVAKLDVPLFSSSSWGTDELLVFLPHLGNDRNTLKGLRLPHLRTELPGGKSIGGPLGFYRGVECGNDETVYDFLVGCELSGDPAIYNMAGGSFIPYAPDHSDPCESLYPTSDAYSEAVEDAALYASNNGWILEEDVASVVAAAVDAASIYPGCLP